MKKVYKYIATASLAMLALTGKAQDPEFSQFFATNTLLNPAFAGNSTLHKVQLAHRAQWSSINNAYQTTFASYQYTARQRANGMGGYVLHDRAANGALVSSFVGLQYAHDVKLNKSLNFRMGYEAAWVQKHVDWDKLSFSDMIDPQQGFIYATQQQRGAPVRYADFSVGGLLYNPHFYIGGAVDHLTEPYHDFLNSMSRTKRKYAAHGGAVIELDRPGNQDVIISPNVMFNMQGAHRLLRTGLYVSKQKLTLGGWYSWGEAVILLVGFDAENLKIGYSYDIAVNALNMPSAGSHELTLQWYIPGRYKRRRFKTISCPSF